MAEEISNLSKTCTEMVCTKVVMDRCKNFKLSRSHDLRSGHMTYHHASVINLYLQATFHLDCKYLVDRRMYVWRYGWTDIGPASLRQLRQHKK